MEFFETSLNLTILNNKVEHKHFFFIGHSKDITSTGSFYDAGQNSATIPAGFIQPPFFHPIFPYYRKFGTFGFIVAHEIVHSLDAENHRFDNTGTVKYWWPYNTSENYRRRIGCFERLYNNSLGSGIDGKFTLSENLADNVGIKIAYLAYKDWLNNNTNTNNLKQETIGDLSSEALFFISSVQWMCKKDTYMSSYYWNPNENDPHAPIDVRILGTMSNSKGFSETFQCKNGERFYRKARCSLW